MLRVTTVQIYFFHLTWHNSSKVSPQLIWLFHICCGQRRCTALQSAQQALSPESCIAVIAHTSGCCACHWESNHLPACTDPQVCDKYPYRLLLANMQRQFEGMHPALFWEGCSLCCWTELPRHHYQAVSNSAAVKDNSCYHRCLFWPFPIRSANAYAHPAGLP